MTLPESPARIKRPDTRRQELLDAALDLLLEGGLGALRVEDVTAAAGAAKGTFYRYFTSKDDLLMALRLRYADDFMDHIVHRLDAAADRGWAERISALVEAGTDFAVANIGAHNVLFHLPGVVPSDPHELHGLELPFITWLADFIRAGTADGAFSVADPDTTALLFYSAFHGSLDREAHRGPVDRARICDALVSLLSRAVGLPDAKAVDQAETASATGRTPASLDSQHSRTSSDVHT